MPHRGSRLQGTTARYFAARFVVYILVILLLANLNSLVDVVLHPEIPYFDEEHLIVGGVTALVSILVFGLLALYTRHLRAALTRISSLETLLSICAHCKRIREPGADAERQESWKQLESYITEKTATQFSHGLCPECAAKLYPQLMKKRRNDSPAA